MSYRAEACLNRRLLFGLLGTTSALVLISAGSAACAASTDATASDASATAAKQPPPGDGGVDLPVITVEARRVEENIQKVPLTVTALGPEQLQVENIQTSHDLQFIVPSLSIAQSYGVNTQSYIVRGLGAGLAEYFSEAPCCAATPSSFFDVSSVQVLNGVQGTLFGRSSASGALLVVPQHPVMDSYGGFADVTVGDYDHDEIKGAVNIPLVTDHLALRLAMDQVHTEGYTSQFGWSYNTANGPVAVPASSEKLDGVDAQQFRIGLEFKEGGFDNYLVASFLNEDGTPHSQVLSGADPDIALLGSPYTSAGTYASFCTAAFKAGIAPGGVANCETERASLNVAARTSLIAEAARLAAGGSVRETPAPYNAMEEVADNKQDTVVDVAQYDFGAVGPAHVSMKNIFGFSTQAGVVSGPVDGVGGMLEEFAGPDGGSGGSASKANQIGNELSVGTGKSVDGYTEEFQLLGDFSDDLLKWAAGGIVLYNQIPNQTQEGPTTSYQLLQGILTTNLGNQTGAGYEYGGFSREYGVYGQATLDLSRFGIHGLSFTAGYRYSWDRSGTNTVAAIAPYAAAVNTATTCTEAGSTNGAFLPSYCPATGALNITTGAVSKSAGYNYTFSLSEQATEDLLFYATIARAYIPGGANGPSGPLAESEGAVVPNFTPTYQPETILDYELGAKYDFQVMGMKGRVDADLYRLDYTNIDYTSTGVFLTTTTPATAISVSYTENAAAAILQGVELQATLFPTPDWQVSLSGSYEDNYYTRFVGSDPLSIVTYANAASYGVTCQPGSVPNTKTAAGICLMNLANQGFDYAPALKGSLTVRYRLPLDEKLGEMWLTAVSYGQSLELFYPYSQRLQQAVAAQDGNSSIGGWSQGAFGTLNLRADWTNVEGSRWNAALYVDNVTNTTYALTAYPQVITLGVSPKTYAPPIMFGVELSTKF